MKVNRIYQESKLYNSSDGDYFRVRVTSVDHNETIDDMQKESKLSALTPEKETRGYHVAGAVLGVNGELLVDIIVPPKTTGDFKLPQKGDIIWCYRRNKGLQNQAVYAFSEYSGEEAGKGVNSTIAPMFGSMPGDYGHLRTYQDHNVQAIRTGGELHSWDNVPKVNGNFITQYVRSITGYRFRNFYKSNLTKGRFILRGDNVFDINSTMNDPVVEENGTEIIPKGVSQAEYPNPLNVPSERKPNKDFTYLRSAHKYLKNINDLDPYVDISTVKELEEDTYDEVVGNNKDYYSYQPIIDKAYKSKSGVEREMPAGEEYKVAVKGDNLLYIGDMAGDMEQLLILLKNMYDAGISIVQNGDKSQLRLRDHVGNTILLEGTRENPRTVIVTPSRQVFEMGSVKGKGSFIYMRNGPKWGESDVSWGESTGQTLNSVPNQELVMVDGKEIVSDPDFSKRLSSGMAGMLQGSGIYSRNTSKDGKWEQSHSIWELEGELYGKTFHRYQKTEAQVTQKVLAQGEKSEIEFITKNKGILINDVKYADDGITFKKYHQKTTKLMSDVKISDSEISLTKYKNMVGIYLSNVKLDDSGISADTIEKVQITTKKGMTVTTPEKIEFITKEFDVS